MSKSACCGAAEEAEVQVFGEEAVHAARLVQALLPWAAIAPAATLRRLMLDAALNRRQVTVRPDAHAHSPLAALSPSDQNSHC